MFVHPLGLAYPHIWPGGAEADSIHVGGGGGGGGGSTYTVQVPTVE